MSGFTRGGAGARPYPPVPARGIAALGGPKGLCMSAAPLPRSTATATIVLTLLGWSSIPLFLRHFTGLIDPWTANGWRYAFSALLWAPVLVVGARRGTLPKGLWRAALVPSLLNIVGQILYGWAPYLVQPGLMTFSMRLQIVFVALGAAALFPSERAVLRRPAFLAGLLVVIAGTLATIALKPGGLGLGSARDGATLAGVLVAVGSGIFYAAYALAVRRWMHAMPAFPAFAAVSQYTAVGLLVPMLVLGAGRGVMPLGLPPGQLGLLLLSAVIGIGLGHTMYFFSLARLGVAVSSGVVQLQPVLVSVASIRLFGEPFTTAQWWCGALAIAGAIVMLVVQHRALGRSRPAEPARADIGLELDIGSDA